MTLHELEERLAGAPIRALYDPSTKRVACVLLQAAYGGDKRACHILGADRWETSPTADFVWVEGTVEQWRALERGDLVVRAKLAQGESE